MKIVIVGGGTAGWMTGMALSSALPRQRYTLELIESDAIGTVGVGEATLPQLWAFNAAFGIDEAELMAKTNATFKLGIEFIDWGYKGSAYIHPFSIFGAEMGGTSFHQQWLRARQAGHDFPLEEMNYGIVASRAHKFAHPSQMPWVKNIYDYAYHLDASLYAAHLRTIAERQGLKRTQGRIETVNQNPETGDVTSVTLESGEEIAGDLFIDCSGFRALVIGKTLGADFEEWTKWLPCDRAVAVPCDRVDPLLPYTKATAQEAGWQWRIPLQHRTGNGYVYSSAFISDDEAASNLLSRLDGKPQADPKFLKFTAGRRTTSWAKNCVAMGLSSGFLEPLESTSIYLIQQAIMNFLDLLPLHPSDPVAAREYNRRVDLEYERVRDFLILHYHANTRDDAELWRYVREMDVPESLTAKLEMFRHRGHIDSYKDGLFGAPSWLAVYAGQGVLPDAYERLSDNIPLENVVPYMQKLHDKIHQDIDGLPTHDETVRQYCPSAQAEMAGPA